MKTNTSTMELRTLYHRYMTEGLLIAGVVHFALIGGVQTFLRYNNIEDKIPPIIIRDGIHLILPIFNDKPTLPILSIAKPNFANKGIPVPIPESEFNPETTFDPQSPITESRGSDIGVDGGSGTIISEGTTIENDDIAPEVFNPGIEKYPAIIYHPAPKYPEVARRAGVEGTVFIKMWVTKEGTVKVAEIVKSTAAIFDQAAIDAAVLWKFTPAIMNNKPVSVWVTVPFKFRLNAF
jgi:protein TonB